MAVAGVLPAVAGDLVRLADAAGRQHNRLGLEDDEPALLAVVAEGAADAVAVLEEPDDRAFHVDRHALMDAVILQRADHLQAGAVADVGQTWILVAAEVALEDAAIFRAIEDGPPGFEFTDAVRRFLGVQLGHAPVVDVLAAAHRVGEVDLPVVAVIDVGQGRRDAALGHDGVRLAQQRFAHQADGDAGRGRFDGGPQSGAAGADDQDVVFVQFVIGHGWVPCELSEDKNDADGRPKDQHRRQNKQDAFQDGQTSEGIKIRSSQSAAVSFFWVPSSWTVPPR